MKKSILIWTAVIIILITITNIYALDSRLDLTQAEKQQALHFAVRKDWPELVSIFNKVVATITEKEKSDINKKWIDLDTRLDYGPFIRAVVVIVIFFIIVLAVSSFWIMRLRKEIYQRKQMQVSLERANEEADKANENLRKANEELEKISMVDGRNRVAAASSLPEYYPKNEPVPG